mmetsp:Transcript_4815/g.14040  ORF Transcript_4815/g.14040 Transcript_4815/m.14040 type:complete len:196 (-) Transcript_4815:76-663(-)
MSGNENSYATGGTSSSNDVFDALDAQSEDEDVAEMLEASNRNASAKSNPRDSRVYRMPVTLYTDEESGEQFFYLEKGTIPGRPITNLKILYTDDEKKQVHEQVMADNRRPEVMLKDVQIECYLGNDSENENKENDSQDTYLSDESFRLSGSKIGAIHMRMYAKQKEEAQRQLQEDPERQKITLRLDIECRLENRA